MILSILLFLATTIPAPTREPAEISDLNGCIQTRFLDRKAFGMMRIAPSQFHGRGIFQPENPTELAVVDRLRKRDLEVAVFLVGRQALMDLPIQYRRAGLQGPASITLRDDTQLPDKEAVFLAGKTALARIGDGPGYDLKEGDWTIAMRPLRASNETCIQCHSGVGSKPKLGDALGIAMYVYRHRLANSD